MPEDLHTASTPNPLYTTSTVDISGGPPEGVGEEYAAIETSSSSGFSNTGGEGLPASSLHGSCDLAGDMSELSLARKNLDVMQRTKSGIKVSSPHFVSNPASAVSSPLNSGTGTVHDRDGKLVEKMSSGLMSFKRNPAQHRKRYGSGVRRDKLFVAGPRFSRHAVCLSRTLRISDPCRTPPLCQCVCDRGGRGHGVGEDDGV